MHDLYLVSELELHYNKKVKASDRQKLRCSNDANYIFKSIKKYNDNIEIFECFYAMYLNRANKILSVMLISEGGTSGTVTDIKKILAPAILQNASGIIISHNHPSGNVRPSEADKQTTEKISHACKLMDIELLDHLILTDESYYSFADEGEL